MSSGSASGFHFRSSRTTVGFPFWEPRCSRTAFWSLTIRGGESRSINWATGRGQPLFDEPNTFAASRVLECCDVCFTNSVPASVQPIFNNGWPRSGPQGIHQHMPLARACHRCAQRPSTTENGRPLSCLTHVAHQCCPSRPPDPGSPSCRQRVGHRRKSLRPKRQCHSCQD